MCNLLWTHRVVISISNAPCMYIIMHVWCKCTKLYNTLDCIYMNHGITMEENVSSILLQVSQELSQKWENYLVNA